MSHVVAIRTELKDLKAVQTACRDLGLVFKPNQKTYQWWGYSVGDYRAQPDSALAQGRRPEDLGKCDHAIGVPGTTWEIGLVGTPTGGWKLEFDYFGSQGRPIVEAIGQDGGKFIQAYAVAKATLQAKAMGMFVKRERKPDGTVKLTLTSY